MLKIKLLSFSAILLLTLSGCVFNDTIHKGVGLGVGSGDELFFGTVKLHNVIYKNIVINGTARLDNVFVAEQLGVNGNLSANKTTIGAMTVNGNADLQKVTVKGLSAFNGYLQAKDSSFGKIIFGTRNAILSDSTTKLITVRKEENITEQIIELDNTKVDGDIVFEGGNGKVLLKGDSEVVGKINGGILIPVKPC